MVSQYANHVFGKISYCVIDWALSLRLKVLYVSLYAQGYNDYNLLYLLYVYPFTNVEVGLAMNLLARFC